MESQVTLHWGVLGFTFALATVSIGLRLGSRYLTRAKFWWDDAFAILGYVSSFDFHLSSTSAVTDLSCS
jgi:hypothetical protein